MLIILKLLPELFPKLLKPLTVLKPLTGFETAAGEND